MKIWTVIEIYDYEPCAQTFDSYAAACCWMARPYEDILAEKEGEGSEAMAMGAFDAHCVQGVFEALGDYSMFDDRDLWIIEQDLNSKRGATR